MMLFRKNGRQLQAAENGKNKASASSQGDFWLEGFSYAAGARRGHLPGGHLAVDTAVSIFKMNGLGANLSADQWASFG